MMNAGVACFGSPIDRLIGASFGFGRHAGEEQPQLLERVRLEFGEVGIHPVRADAAEFRRPRSGSRGDYTGRFSTTRRASPATRRSHSIVAKLAPHAPQTGRIQVVRRPDDHRCSEPARRRSRSERLRQVQHHRRGALGARRDPRERAARRVDAGRDLQRLGAARPGGAGERRARVRQQPRQGRRPVVAVRRDLGQARPAARRRIVVPHQQHAGPPPRHPRHLPRHRTRPARVRDHRAGDDLAGDRGEAGGAAHLPGGGGRRLQVQGAAPRDRASPRRHAGEPGARRRHPARARDADREAHPSGRDRAPVQGAAGRGRAQAEPAVVAAQARRRERSPARRRGRSAGLRPSSRPRPRACARSNGASSRRASTTTRPATRSTPRRARSTR